MLTFTWRDVLVAEERHKDMLERAKRARELRLMQKDQQSLSLSARWLFAFGEQLVNWGCGLQAHYRQVAPQLGTTSRCDSPAVGSAPARNI